jgi:hypothetical protein
MSDELLQFTCTIPPGTPISAPVTIPMSMQLWEIESVDVEVPSGPSGLMGFYLAVGDEPWIPHDVGEWIVWDNQSSSWTLSNQPTSYGWNLVGYNTGVYPHNVTVRFHVNEPASAIAASVPTLTIVTTPVASGTTVL